MDTISPPDSAEICRRLLCDAGIVPILNRCRRHPAGCGDGSAAHGDRLRFFDPAGAEIPNTGPPAPIASLPSVAYTPAPGWDGDPVNYDAPVACLT